MVCQTRPGRLESGEPMTELYTLVAEYLIAGAIFGLGLIYRLHFLGEPYRCDEAFTYLNYASKPVAEIVRSYNLPNNHILHSIVVHFTTSLFGFTPMGLRLPVWISGVLLIAAAGLMAWQLSQDRRTALLTSLFLSVSPIMVFYRVNARGYMLQALLSTIAASCYFHEGMRTRPGVIIPTLSVLLALILYTSPSGPSLRARSGSIYSGVREDPDIVLVGTSSPWASSPLCWCCSR